MRACWALLVAFLISFCPLFCCADEIGHSARHADGGQADQHNGDSPDHCPDTVDNCVCQGAVRADHTRPISLDSVVFGLIHPFLPQLNPPIQAHRLTPGGSPTGLALLGDALTVRAYLQIFRF